jgi:hypothetical protein
MTLPELESKFTAILDAHGLPQTAAWGQMLLVLLRIAYWQGRTDAGRTIEIRLDKSAVGVLSED